MKRITKHVTKKTFYRKWKETVVGLKMNIHQNHVQFSKKQ